MTKTTIGTNIERPAIGYMINAPLSPANQQLINDIQKRIKSKFGEAIWNAPMQSLHITLLDWLAPLVDYEKDKARLFNEIYKTYDDVMTSSLSKTQPITVQFDTIHVGPAAIWISGSDDGEFARIRKEFLNGITLLPNTKQPPTIIHSTICRFKSEINLEPIQDLIKKIPLDFEQHIPTFRLVRETIDPMLEFELLKEYPLKEDFS